MGKQAQLTVSSLIGAYCTARAADRHGLGARVRQSWDVLLPVLRQGPGRPVRARS